ncbi:Twitching motility protein PilT [Labilithrix luteola]|uniref:Twitching motility protein PilT n=1 Tax=Labilithrix luteola TaxID=1391654 RepID=A0A0K1QBC1_9BACT|nr:ATPase, T2SS/T4P/T4SS family [Labilithrix luteola]AKV02967.1 Twitching motility protein PilT [Labilithrix luteola]
MPKIDLFFDEVLQRGGTDLHLGGGSMPMVRVQGELVPLGDSALEPNEVEALVFELLGPAERERLDAELGVEFAIPHKEAGRFRASVFRRSGGIGAVFRHVPRMPTKLDDLACPDALARAVSRRSGLVLLAGGPRTGKSTLLAALVELVNRTRACHVLTVERPIEFVHTAARAQITQRELDTHVLSQAAALRGALRENADVVVVSELTSVDAARAAFDLAASGILVVASVRASDTVTALRQLASGTTAEESASLRKGLASTLAVMVTRRLVRTADGKSRVPAHAVLVGPPARELLQEGRFGELAALMEASHAQGMQTIDTALERLVAQGRITFEAALEEAFDKEAFARLVGRPPASTN